MPRNALGRGLSALIREPEPLPPPPQAPPQDQLASEAPQWEVSTPDQTAATSTQPIPPVVINDGFLQIDIDLIDPSPYQPRTRFREEALDELSRSIIASGIVQPLVVRRIGTRYQLIAGERRWRAAQRAALRRVPVVIRDVSEEHAIEMTLVENLQREDLNPVEQARAFQRLIDDFGLTQERVADRTGKDRATIANAIRLLKLEEPILDLLEGGQVTPGHARALLAIEDSHTRIAVARRVARGGISVRQVERLATRGDKTRVSSVPATPMDPNTKAAIEELQQRFGTRVILDPLRQGKPGRLIFEYYDNSDLAQLYDRFMK